VLENLRDLFKHQGEKANHVLSEMKLLGNYCDAMEISSRLRIDPTLARGLDYYTGLIFEGVIVGGEEAKLGLGSIAAGGRYDNLIGMFSKFPIPSAGGSLGIERIFNILEKRTSDQLVNPIDVMIGTIGTVPRDHVLRVAAWLWGAG
jgi:histidyl-tRNA synthetase